MACRMRGLILSPICISYLRGQRSCRRSPHKAFNIKVKQVNGSTVSRYAMAGKNDKRWKRRASRDCNARQSHSHGSACSVGVKRNLVDTNPRQFQDTFEVLQGKSVCNFLSKCPPRIKGQRFESSVSFYIDRKKL